MLVTCLPVGVCMHAVCWRVLRLPASFDRNKGIQIWGGAPRPGAGWRQALLGDVCQPRRDLRRDQERHPPPQTRSQQHALIGPYDAHARLAPEARSCVPSKSQRHRRLVPQLGDNVKLGPLAGNDSSLARDAARLFRIESRSATQRCGARTCSGVRCCTMVHGVCAAVLVELNSHPHRCGRTTPPQQQPQAPSHHAPGRLVNAHANANSTPEVST